MRDGNKNCEPMDIDFEKLWNNPMEERYVGYQIKMMDRTICKRVVKQFQDHCYEGMTRLSNWILEYLENQEPEITYQKDIERVFGIGKSTIAGSMKVLEKNGLIERKSVEGDARLKQICLTKDGKAFIEKIKQSKREFESQLTRDLSPDEIDMFFDILQKMRKNIAE
ncbi:MAG: MarR family winged helix-turn-helix transcriptional regulator [Eubacteriales bacterium]|nr:MarR family winged helix-turn-helix transcriptional regulator [Eubacteriales bacterium]